MFLFAKKKLNGTQLVIWNGKQNECMNEAFLNLCSKCVHAPHCVLTHNQSSVFSCSEFDGILHQPPTPTLKIKKRAMALETI